MVRKLVRLHYLTVADVSDLARDSRCTWTEMCRRLIDAGLQGRKRK